MKAYNKVHIADAASTLVYSGPCVLRYITVNTTAAGATTVADALSDTTPVVAILKSSIAEGTYRYDCVMATGLFVKTGHADQDITVVYEAL
jgi:hypothetical protein